MPAQACAEPQWTAISSPSLALRQRRGAVPPRTVRPSLTTQVREVVLPPKSGFLLYASMALMMVVLTRRQRFIALGTSPDWLYLGLSTLSSCALLVVGFHVFKRLEPEFAEVV